MKQLNNVTLVNGLSEIYQLFTQLYPEMVAQVKEWYQWGAYTDTNRGLVIQLHNESKLLFSVHRFDDEEGWCVCGCYMVPAYVTEIPEQITDAAPAMDIGDTENPDTLLDIFCRMFPSYQSEIISSKIWRRYDAEFRGLMIDLRDRKRVLFSAKKQGKRWDAGYPILVPSPDEDDCPSSEIDRIIMSDVVIFWSDGEHK